MCQHPDWLFIASISEEKTKQKQDKTKKLMLKEIPLEHPFSFFYAIARPYNLMYKN